MFYEATKKVPGGKLIRVKIDADDHVNAVHIYGDFFLHPEDALPSVEKELSGMSKTATADEIAARIQAGLNPHKAAFVGVSPEDIAETIIAALAAPKPAEVQ